MAPWAILRRHRYFVWLCGIEVFPPRPDFEGTIGLRWAARCLSISDYTRSKVLERYPKLHIRTCELALDPTRTKADLPETPVQRKLNVCLKSADGSMQPLGEKVVLHVGRMELSERYKGQETLLNAFSRIHAQFPDVQLILAGDGDDRAYLLAIARSLPASLQVQIFMPGYVENDLLNDLYDQCYLFAMPSSGEGFGIVYLEAMAHGKPCLGGRVDATPGIVREGVTGCLVDDPRSPAEIAEKVGWLLARPEEAARMGKAGYELVRSNYLFCHFKERFLAALAD